MIMLSEQVKELREKSWTYCGLEVQDIMLKAADTIEALSEKLTANMERPDMISRDKLIEEIDKELSGVIVKDTYSKGKNAGLRKAKILAEEQPEVRCGGWIYCGDENNLPRESGEYDAIVSDYEIFATLHFNNANNKWFDNDGDFRNVIAWRRCES